jgi:hypothetical protein
MAEASRSLSAKRALERMHKYRHAVIVLAMQRAKKSVLAQLRAQGLKPQRFSAREISVLADVEFERNRARLIADAEHSIETWPGFAPYRLGANISNNAQATESSNSTTSTVQNSGAK